MKKDRREYYKKYYFEKAKPTRMSTYYKNRLGYLKDKSCVMCGSIENLEIDHIDKNNKKSHVIWLWSEKSRAEELKKCQVLCHVCHKIKTNTERGFRSDHSYSAYVSGRCKCEICHLAYNAVREKYNEKRRIKRALARRNGSD